MLLGEDVQLLLRQVLAGVPKLKEQGSDTLDHIHVIWLIKADDRFTIFRESFFGKI